MEKSRLTPHVHAQNFVKGFGFGLAGFVTDPYKGAKQDGLLGFTKGVATGSMGLIVKPGAGTFVSSAIPPPFRPSCKPKRRLTRSCLVG